MPRDIRRVSFKDKHCHFISHARTGDIFYAKGEDISCPLARFYLGLEDSNLEKLAGILVNWNDAINKKVALLYLKSAKCIGKGEKYIIYFPCPEKNLKPDVLIKICTPSEIMIMVQKFSYLTGMRINASISGIGAACGECTAYPLVTRRENVSLGCYGSRPGISLKEGELFLAFPSNSKMIGII